MSEWAAGFVSLELAVGDLAPLEFVEASVGFVVAVGTGACAGVGVLFDGVSINRTS